jgi:hypothetical protein
MPTGMAGRNIHLVVFELITRLGVSNYVAIPVAVQDDDSMIAEGRAGLHEMLSSLAEESQIWKPESREDGDTH